MIFGTHSYTGIPPLGYGQDYYTLRSVFFDGVAPPAIHIHLRMFEVAAQVPIGDLSATNAAESPEDKMSKKRVVEVDIPEAEKAAFDLWLRKLWQEKDESMTRFNNTGAYSAVHGTSPIVQVPLKLHRKREILDAFCFFMPAAAGYLWGRIRR